MEEELVKLGSAGDIDSCLVMCQVLPGNTPDRLVGQATIGEYRALRHVSGVYVPLGPEHVWRTNYLTGAAALGEDKTTTDVPFFSHQAHRYTMATTDDRPAYRPLVVAGHRLLHVPPAYPALPFTGGWRDCWLEWLPINGDAFSDFATISNDGARIHVAKHVVGALFSSTQEFDGKGKPDGYTTTMICIEATWYLGPPDELKLDLYGHVSRRAGPYYTMKPPGFFRSLRPSWSTVFDRAIAGFRENCSPWPNHAEENRTTYWANRAEIEQARTVFAAQIRHMDWMNAFDLVETVAQLVVACEVLQPPEFANRRTPNKRGRDMVKLYAESHPERAELIGALWEDSRPFFMR